jgi:hypothetical protein
MLPYKMQDQKRVRSLPSSTIICQFSFSEIFFFRDW